MLVGATEEQRKYRATDRGGQRGNGATTKERPEKKVRKSVSATKNGRRRYGAGRGAPSCHSTSTTHHPLPLAKAPDPHDRRVPCVQRCVEPPVSAPADLLNATRGKRWGVVAPLFAPLLAAGLGRCTEAHQARFGLGLHAHFSTTHVPRTIQQQQQRQRRGTTTQRRYHGRRAEDSLIKSLMMSQLCDARRSGWFAESARRKASFHRRVSTTSTQKLPRHPTRRTS
jgi:hypothetical protein